MKVEINTKRVDTFVNEKTYRKLQGEAKELGRTFRKHCSIILETHAAKPKKP